MVQVEFNFGHPFRGKVLIRKTGYTQWFKILQFDSKGKYDFAIPFEVPEDGNYQVILEWEFEGRTFFYESKIIVKDGRLIAERNIDS